ncbi:MAG: orotidine-5'-phosphate decarboxylase [Spirochaetes bacterium]|nr:orotidine-5'-phosphate decarboxylase [Spirochaetota bacterium]
MNYLELLKQSSKKFNSIVSMGLDPVIEDIPVKKGSNKEKIISFYESILNKISQEGIYPGAVKPNYAFYAQYGIEGIEALLYVITLFKSQNIPVILDAKRGDIAKTALAYAKECFDFFKADAVTLAPYMGYDSIAPFTDNYPDKGFYVLNKTSNKSSRDFQDIIVNGNPLYLHVSKKIIDWHSPGLGAVIGATYPSDLKSISDIFIKSNKKIPLLIPGIGSQGGDLKEIISILKTYPDINIHRINSSSEINYAYKKYVTMSFSEASVEALKYLNNQVSEYLC